MKHVWLSEVFSEVILKMGIPTLHLCWETHLDHIWTHAFWSKHLLHQAEIYQSLMTSSDHKSSKSTILIHLSSFCLDQQLFSNAQTFPKPAVITPLHPPPFVYQPSVSFVVPCRATSSAAAGSSKETGSQPWDFLANDPARALSRENDESFIPFITCV